MKLLQNILCPVDFSDSSDKAIENSILIAKVFHSHITIMHVIAEENISSGLMKVLEETIKEKLENIATRVKSAGVDVRNILVEKGVPFEKVIQEAQNNNYNVIVAGSGNKTSNDLFKLGTTVEKLMRKNQIPLWVVKNENVRDVKKIVCPVDFSDSSARALKNAITVAHKFNAELFVLNVYEPVNYFSKRFEVDNARENADRKKKQEEEFYSFLEMFNLTNVNYHTETVEGEPFFEILKFIMANATDLLLIGTTGKTGLSKLLMGSVTEKVTRELPCSFITTKAIDITDDYIESNLRSIESILNSAKAAFEKKDYDTALDKYSIALKQYPDNIPVILGLIEIYELQENKSKANYYREYAREVVKRIWGDKFLNKLNF